MRLAALLVVLASLPCTASADAIEISSGFCPPGLDHGVQHHSDACTPRACTSDVQCGEGAACHEIAECWTQESTNSIDGRVVLPQPVMVDVVQGLCRPDHTCAVGTCSVRRQCEPTSPSAAWDPAQQRWTGTFLDSEPGHGCSASPGRSGRGAGSLALALGALTFLASSLRRRRAQSTDPFASRTKSVLPGRGAELGVAPRRFTRRGRGSASDPQKKNA